MNLYNEKETKYDNLYLGDGKNGIYSTDPAISKTNNNVLVFAGTNRGKTTSIVEPYLLHVNHSSMAIMLTKRRLLDQYAPLLSSRGYDVKVLDLVNPEKTQLGFDPMRHVKSDMDLTGLAKMLVARVASEKEPYWHHSSANLFKALARLAVYKYGKNKSMETIFKLVLLCKHSSMFSHEQAKKEGMDIAIEFEKLKRLEPEMYDNWTQFFFNAENTGNCILSELKTALSEVFPNSLRGLMAERSQLDFLSLVNRKTCLFVLTSPVNPALHTFANILFSFLFKELFEYAENLPDGKLPRPFTAICDDFATGSKIPDFQHYLSIFREKGISAIMLVQSLAQLNAMYGPDNAATIIDNTDNLVYLGGMDRTTALEVSMRSDRPIQEILSMGIGREFLFRSGQKPLFLDRYQTYQDPVYVHSFTKSRDNRRIC